MALTVKFKIVSLLLGLTGCVGFSFLLKPAALASDITPSDYIYSYQDGVKSADTRTNNFVICSPCPQRETLKYEIHIPLEVRATEPVSSEAKGGGSPPSLTTPSPINLPQSSKEQPFPFQPEMTTKVENKSLLMQPSQESLPAMPPKENECLIATPYFSPNSSELSEEERVKVKLSLLPLDVSQFKFVSVVGFTSADGSREFNEKLAHERAQAVSQLLKESGIRTVNETNGLGQCCYVSDQNSLNRRVEVRVRKEGPCETTSMSR